LYDALLDRATKLRVKIVWGEKVKSVKKTSDGFIVNEKHGADKLINTIPST